MYKKNDLVVVVGSVVTATKHKKTAKLATVVEVGLYDLILEDGSGHWRKHFIAPKSTCIKIKKDWLHAPHSPLPQIGDLVMYYKKSTFGEEIEKEVGHLHEIEYTPGSDPTAKIDLPNGLKSFTLKDLIIIEKAKTKTKR